MYRIDVTRKAQKSLRAIEPMDQRKIARAIDGLASEPRPRGAKKLEGGAGEWRVRIGNYRIIYEINDDILRVLVLVIGKRKDVYRRR
jgi:mRNA interferase RelE/StbE